MIPPGETDIGVGVGVGVGVGSLKQCIGTEVREARNGMKSRLVVGSSLWERWKGRRGGRSSTIAGIRRLKRW